METEGGVRVCQGESRADESEEADSDAILPPLPLPTLLLLEG